MAKKVDTSHKIPKGLSKTEIEKGVTARDRGVYIPPEQRDATDPEMLHVTKAEHIKRQNAKKEKSLEMQRLSREYDEKKRKGAEAPKPEAPVEKPKKRGGKKNA